MDLGETFRPQTDEVIFGSYFFLSETLVYHKLNRYTTTTYVTEMGGLMKSISFFVGFFMYFYQTRSQAAHVMTNLYFKENSASKNFKTTEDIVKRTSMKSNEYLASKDLGNLQE